MKRLARFVLLFVVVALLAVPAAALAKVRLEGTWPDSDKKVALDVEGVPRAQALKRLADAAGWSLVVTDAPTDKVDIHVKDQPARKVLDILLSEGSYVAKRDGDLVSIDHDKQPAPPAASAPEPAPPAAVAPPAPVAAPEPPAAPAPASPPSPPSHARRGEDRTITGGNLQIEKDEVVHDVTVFGGNVEVLGTVTGDLSVFGGNVRIANGGHVEGDASVMGGQLNVEDGARVDGDVSVIGGLLQRGDKAQIGGDVSTMDHDKQEDSDEHHASASKAHVSAVHSLAHEIGGSVTAAALLFVFGAVLLALASKRLEDLRVEVAARPMRSFALGVVGSIAAITLIVALCITIIGIPVAIVGVLVGVLAVYAGIAAVLTTVGEALLRHKTQNPYVHLALGCALLVVVGAVPYVGTLAKVVVAFCGIGVLVATRGAGLAAPRRPTAASWGSPASP